MRPLVAGAALAALCLTLPAAAIAWTPSAPAIVGGATAAPGAWPALAALIHHGQPASTGEFCGATVVGRRWLLTAAHCTYAGTGAALAPTAIDALVGTADLARGGTRLAIDQILRHPSWAKSTLRFDAALLHLTTATSQRALPIATRVPAAGTALTVVGWGSIDAAGRSYPTLLQQGAVQLLSDAACATPYATAFQPASMLCAGAPTARIDACFGDSGGPLVQQTASGWREVGIVSWGRGCAVPGRPGVYTRAPVVRCWVGAKTGIGAPPAPRLTRLADTALGAAQVVVAPRCSGTAAGSTTTAVIAPSGRTVSLGPSGGVIQIAQPAGLIRPIVTATSHTALGLKSAPAELIVLSRS